MIEESLFGGLISSIEFDEEITVVGLSVADSGQGRILILDSQTLLPQEWTLSDKANVYVPALACVCMYWCMSMCMYVYMYVERSRDVVVNGSGPSREWSRLTITGR